jgi:hypothetical protein
MNPKDMEWQGVEWVNVSQSVDKRRVVVITVMDNRVTGNAGNYSLAENRSASQEELCSM